ncbi:hypothetical protein [Ralstonia pseudosolanacearum]|uniref:hypothetical protein n=1 Tax=Ralstonia pseudosolanacearum TaxID=1310165 RepID=UPI003CF6012F
MSDISELPRHLSVAQANSLKGIIMQTIMTSTAMLYTDGRLAVQLYDSEGPYCRLSVNILGSQLAEDEITVNAWDLDDELLQSLLASGKYAMTGRSVPSGYVEAPVWKILCPTLLEEARALRASMKSRKTSSTKKRQACH